MNDVTQILRQIEQGDPRAAEQLLPLVYNELRKLAAVKLASEKLGQTLQPTALVHDAYVRLVESDQPQHWPGRGYFFSAAAEAMRRILVEQARRKQSRKRGGGWTRVSMDTCTPEQPRLDDDILALNDAVEELERRWPEKASVVKLRFFAGLTMKEAAAVLGISLATAERHWMFARAWLHKRLKNG